MVGIICSALRCGNYKVKCANLSFFRFPKDAERCKIWLINCERDDLYEFYQRDPGYLYDNCRLCALHFEDNQFVDQSCKNRLKLSAVPTLFNVLNLSPHLTSTRQMPKNQLDDSLNDSSIGYLEMKTKPSSTNEDAQVTEQTIIAETKPALGAIVIANSSMMATRSTNLRKTRDVSFKRRYSLPLSDVAVASTPDKPAQVSVSGGTPSSAHSTRSFSGRKIRSRHSFATASEVPGSVHKSERKRPADVDSSSLGSIPKRLRTIRTTGAGECVESDAFCWVCHTEGDASDCCCELCPRLYHVRCLGTEHPSDSWVCPECEKVMKAEAVDNRSKAMSMVSIDTLCTLLKFVIQRMKYPDSEPFHRPVDCALFSRYTDYVYNPMDFVTLERNIKKKMYGSTEAFTADVKWILHNCIVYNGKKHKLTSVARTVMKICRHETSEIEVCPDCYLNSCTKPSGDWFCEPCRVPHTLVWAKMKGYPFWPAKVLRQENNQLDVRFFGEHDRAWVPVSQVFMISEEPPTGLKNRKGFDVATGEVRKHVAKLRDQFGSFTYAPHRTPFDPKNPYSKVNFLSPGIKPRMSSSSRSHFNGFRRRKKPTISVVKNTATESGTDRPPVKMILKLPTADKHASIAKETARAVKFKYYSIKTTRRASGTTPTKRIEPTLAMSVTEESFEGDSLDVETLGSRTQDDEVMDESDDGGKEGCCEADETNKSADDTSSHSVSVADVCKSSEICSGSKANEADHLKDNGQVFDKHVHGADSVLNESFETLSAAASEEGINDKPTVDESFPKDSRNEKDAVSLPCADTTQSFNLSSSRSEIPAGKKPGSLSPSTGVVCDKSGDATLIDQTAGSPVDGDISCETLGQVELGSKAFSDSGETSFCNNNISIDDGDGKELAIIGTISCGTDLDSNQNSVLVESTNSFSSQMPAFPTSSFQRTQTPPLRLPSPECQASELSLNKTQTSLTSNSPIRKSIKPSSANINVCGSNSVASSVSHLSIGVSSEVVSTPSVVSRAVATSSSSLPSSTVSSSTLCESVLTTGIESTISAKTVAAAAMRSHSAGSKSVEMAIDKIRKLSTLKQANVSSVNSALLTEKGTGASKTAVIVIDDDDEGSRGLSSLLENKRPVEVAKNSDQAKGMATLVVPAAIASVVPSKAPVVPTSCASGAYRHSQPVKISASGETLSAAVVSNVEGVLAAVPIEAAVPLIQAPVDETQMPSVSNAVSLSSNGPSFSFNVAGYDFSKYHDMIRQSTAQMLEVFCSDMLNSEVGSAVSKHMLLELNRAKWYQAQELEEIRSSYALTLAEQRVLLEEEKEAALMELRERLSREKEQEVSETKKKQWCAQCGKESIFYCCWNTSYCNYPCQQAHWPKHMHSCTQTQQDGIDVNIPSSQSTVAAVSSGGNQSWKATVGQPTRYSSLQANSGQQQQQLISRMTYNASAISNPSASQNPYNVVTSRPWAFTSVQMQSGGLMRQTAAPVQYGQYQPQQQSVVGQPQSGVGTGMRGSSAVRYVPHQGMLSNSTGSLPGSGMMFFHPRPSVTLASNHQSMSQFTVRPR